MSAHVCMRVCGGMYMRMWGNGMGNCIGFCSSFFRWEAGCLFCFVLVVSRLVLVYQKKKRGGGEGRVNKPAKIEENTTLLVPNDQISANAALFYIYIYIYIYIYKKAHIHM